MTYRLAMFLVCRSEVKADFCVRIKVTLCLVVASQEVILILCEIYPAGKIRSEAEREGRGRECMTDGIPCLCTMK